MKLSDWKGEEAIELLADLLDPISEIFTDKEWNAKRKAGATRMELIKLALKGHKKAVLRIMALLNGEDPETYEPNIVQLPITIMQLLNDEELLKLFQSQGQMMPEESSGSAMENTKANVQ